MIQRPVRSQRLSMTIWNQLGSIPVNIIPDALEMAFDILEIARLLGRYQKARKILERIIKKGA